MTYQIIWFVLWGVLWAVYFMLDGFDFGVGILMNFFGKNDSEKRQIINTIGPVWDGNEVWLVTAGGATFAAFPTTYAYMFSFLYSALLIILFALIFRGVAFEFRGKEENPTWKKFWDISIFFGSFIPALLFGVAFGNIFQGLKIDANGYHGTLFSLLNPYALLTGLLFVALFTLHGAIYLSLKTDKEIEERTKLFASKSFYFLLAVALLFLIYTPFATKLFDNFIANKSLFAVVALLVISLLAVKFFLIKKKEGLAFVFSSLTVLLTVATGIIGLYPNLIPSSIDPQYSLTIFNSSSSEYTLKIMTIVAFIFVPIVIAYQIWVYKVLKGKVTTEDVVNDPHSY
jgi:cytochrome d ubiquinol oxidase subunit II